MRNVENDDKTDVRLKWKEEDGAAGYKVGWEGGWEGNAYFLQTRTARRKLRDETRGGEGRGGEGDAE